MIFFLIYLFIELSLHLWFLIIFHLKIYTHIYYTGHGYTLIYINT